MNVDLFSRVCKLLDDLSADWDRVNSVGQMTPFLFHPEELVVQLQGFIVDCEQSDDITDVVAKVGHTLSQVPAIKSYSMVKAMEDIRKEKEEGTFRDADPSEYGLAYRITEPREKALFLSKLVKLQKTISGY